MKLYDKYVSLKLENSSNRYLFKNGNFYIFLDEDAKYISSVTTLKLTAFGNYVKCGFPLQSLDKYLAIFQNIGVSVVIVQNINEIVKQIELLDLNILSKNELIDIIENIKKCLC